MPTYGSIGDNAEQPTQLDIASRVEVQERLVDAISEEVAEAINARVDKQESMLRPVYKTLVKDIQGRIDNQAEMISPVGRRLLTGIRSRIATAQAMNGHVIGALNDAGIDTGNVFTGVIPGVIVGPGRTANLVTPMTTIPGSTGAVIRHDDPIPSSSGEPEPEPPESPIPSPEPGTCPTPIIACPAPIVIVSPPTPPTAAAPKPPTTTSPGTPEPPIPVPIPTPTIPISIGTPSPTPFIPTTPTPYVFTAPPVVPPAVTPRSVLARPFIASDPALCTRIDTYLEQYTELGKHVWYYVYHQMSWINLSRQLLGTFLGFLQDAFSSLPEDEQSHIKKAFNDASFMVRDMVASTKGINLGEYKYTLMGLYFVKMFLGFLRQTEYGLHGIKEILVDGGVDLVIQSRIIDYLIEYVYPTRLPSIAEVMQMETSGQISEDTAACLYRLNGYDATTAFNIRASNRSTLSAYDLVQEHFRNATDTVQLHREMKERGWMLQSERSRYIKLQSIMPTVSDILHWNRRDVFDPTKLGIAEIKEEYKLAKELQQVGRMIGYNPFQVKQPDGTHKTYDPVELDFIATMEEASPTQSYEGLHRLRPGRTHLFEIAIPDKKPSELKTILPGADIRATPDGKGSIVTPKPITLYDVAKNLKENDYNPVWRAMLAAISFRVIGRIDLRRLYRIGVFGPAIGTKGFVVHAIGNIVAIGVAEIELAERYQDEGYSQPDATYLAYYTAYEWEQSTQSGKNKKRVGYYCKAYKLGVVSKEQAIDAVTKILNDPVEAKNIIDTCHLEHNIKLVETVIAIQRNKYLKGIITEDKARQRLGEHGLSVQRIEELMFLWRLELQRKDKDLSAQQMCQQYASGIITRKDFKDRLFNIGYSDADADNIIKHCELGELAKSARVRERQAKAIERNRIRNLTLLQKEERERTKAQEKAFTRFLAFRTEKNLREWWADRSITPELIYQTLILKGASDADARRWIQRNNPDRITGGSNGESTT